MSITFYVREARINKACETCGGEIYKVYNYEDNEMTCDVCYGYGVVTTSTAPEFNWSNINANQIMVGVLGYMRCEPMGHFQVGDLTDLRKRIFLGLNRYKNDDNVIRRLTQMSNLARWAQENQKTIQWD